MKEAVWSADGERYYDDISYVLDEKEVGDIIYCGEPVYNNVAHLINSYDIVEMLGERACDNFGEWAEDWPEPSKESVAELQTFLVEWITKHCHSTFYSVTNIEDYVVTAEDLE